jgi:Concanavalin A-like lectin/glucanases superfamily
MSDFRIDQITNQAGTAGPNIAGITTFSSTSGLLMPRGDTFRRSVLENVVDDGALIYFDFGNDLSYSGTGSFIRNLSEGKNNGEQAGGTYSSSQGGYIEFDGTTDGDGIRFKQTGTNELNPGTANFTIGCWVNFDSEKLYSTGQEVLFGAYNGNAMFGLFFRTSSPYIKWFVRDGSANEATADILDVYTVVASKWYYVVGVREGTKVLLFINGKLISTGTNSSLSDVNISNASYYYGTFNSSAIPSINFSSDSNEVDGKISSGHYYSRALRPDEILQNYNALRSRYSI